MRAQESYEIGSENDSAQPNIWLPDEVLPDFKLTMTALYSRLAGVCRTILDAIGVGLALDETEHAALKDLLAGDHCQLRLLHYPAVTKSTLQNQLLTRLPEHTDWG